MPTVKTTVLTDERVLDEFRKIVETTKLLRLGFLEIQSPTAGVLIDTWSLIMKHHIYEADALQIATAKAQKCRLLFGADKELLGVAKNSGLGVANIESERKRVLMLLEQTS